VLCITEHWLNYQKLHVMNIDNFTVADAFSRTVFLNRRTLASIIPGHKRFSWNLSF